MPALCLCERGTPIENRHAARVVCEEHRRLAGRVASPDDVDVKAVRIRCFAPRHPVIDALSHEAVEPFDRETTPRDTAGKDDRVRPQDITAVEIQLTVFCVDPLDRTGDKDLGAKPACLLERPARERLAGNT